MATCQQLPINIIFIINAFDIILYAFRNTFPMRQLLVCGFFDFVAFNLSLLGIFHVMRVGVTNSLQPPVAAIKSYPALIRGPSFFRFCAMAAPTLTCGAFDTPQVAALAHFYLKDRHVFGNVKDTLLRICQAIGIWSLTFPMVALTVAMVQCQVMTEKKVLGKDPNITPESLGTARSQHPKSLSSLVSSLQENYLTRLKTWVDEACAALQNWMWDDVLAQDDQVYYTVRDVKMVLDDLAVLLTPHLLSQPNEPEWPFS